jgi:hypothetical protein
MVNKKGNEMRTMYDLVRGIVKLDDDDLQLLAEALVMYSDTKAERLEFLLNVMLKEQEPV